MDMISFKKIAAIGVIFSASVLLAACNKNTGTGGATNQTGSNSSSQNAGGSANNSGSGQAAVVIIYSEGGFSPNQATVKVGQKVEIKNTSSKVVQVNSAPHPTHELFPELNLGNIAAGQSETITFAKAGTYSYHNHLNASQNGKIVVE